MNTHMTAFVIFKNCSIRNEQLRPSAWPHQLLYTRSRTADKIKHKVLMAQSIIRQNYSLNISYHLRYLDVKSCFTSLLTNSFSTYNKNTYKDLIAVYLLHGAFYLLFVLHHHIIYHYKNIFIFLFYTTVLL